MAELITPPRYEVVVEPSAGWLSVRWKELWEYRDLLLLFVERDFVARYKQTILGPLWYVLQPLLTTATFVLIFGRVAQLPTDGLPAPLFYLCGLVIWNYFAQNVTTGAAVFSTNAHLFGKVYFPRLIVPASTVLSNLVAFALQLIPLILMYGWYWAFTPFRAALAIHWHLLLIPLLLLQTSLFSLGVGLWLSAASVKYRDLMHLNALLIQLWMFATPVIYPLSKVPPSLSWLVWLNPMAPVVEGFRIAAFSRGAIPQYCFAASLALTAATLITGIAAFQKMERTAMDSV